MAQRPGSCYDNGHGTGASPRRLLQHSRLVHGHERRQRVPPVALREGSCGGDRRHCESLSDTNGQRELSPCQNEIFAKHGRSRCSAHPHVGPETHWASLPQLHPPRLNREVLVDVAREERATTATGGSCTTPFTPSSSRVPLFPCPSSSTTSEEQRAISRV
jgi:hypothetical protein